MSRCPEILVADIPTRDRERIRVTRSIKVGHAATEIRLWFLKAGEWRPSPDHVAIPAQSIGTLADVLQAERFRLTGEDAL